MTTQNLKRTWIKKNQIPKKENKELKQRKQEQEDKEMRG